MQRDKGVAKRARSEQGRSKNGCTTCLQKKVKCDEQRPICGRCTRLQLRCDWVRQKIALSVRRRGHGPMKERDSSVWVPLAISPKCNGPDHVHIATDDFRSGQLEICNSREAVSGLDGIDAFTIVGQDNFRNDIGVNDSDNYSDGTGDNFLNCELASLDRNFSLPVELGLVFGGTSFLESSDQYVSANTLSSDDHVALAFHRTIFAPLRSTRKPTLSPLSLLAQHARNTQTALHFVLAVSYSEMAIHYRCDAQPPSQSLIHFQRGSAALLSKMTSTMVLDHVEVLLSFLYLYHFWLRRRQWSPQRLHDLSTTVLTYIEYHALDDKCEDEISMFLLQHETQAFSNVTVVPRILIYLLDRDAFCAFSGFGGALATYAGKKEALWLRIMENSNAVFPATSPFHASVLNVYVRLIFIHHEINMYSQSQIADAVAKQKIEDKLSNLREENALVFEALTDTSHTNAKDLPVMAFVVLAFLCASDIYLFRSHGAGFGSRPLPVVMQAALESLMNAAYRTTSRIPTQLLERLQWSLLIAAIETCDLVHQDWLQRTISDPAIKSLYTEIQKVKATSGGSVNMQQVRSLFM